MKKVISLALLSATTSLMAIGGEQAYLYKDPRVMGMGGANIAIGSYSSTVFSNPAGLTNIEKKHGYVIDVLSVGVSLSKGVRSVSDDFDKVGDDAAKIEELINKYSGDVFSVQANNYSSVSKNSDLFAWSVGILAATDASTIIHGNGSASGAPVEVAGRAYSGLILGAAKEFDTSIGQVDIGLGMKYIQQTSYEGPLYISNLQGDNAFEQLQDKYEKTSSGFGVDLGVNYKPFKNSMWHPAFGLSVLNIGSLGMDDSYGGQPMTVNLGASISPEVGLLDKLVLAIDYVDLLNANKVRVYTFEQDAGTQSYIDYTDDDMMKRLRIGASFGLIDTQLFSAQINVGLYQAAYTVGLDLAVTALKLNFATYQEQIGTGSVDIPDRRYMAQIGLGW
ncbi:hypothetical protein MNB_SM-4-1811 [hydrothermal vent metagenome]|uniref:Conjugal transfer protein TraF n=1 Tax=hydrothermal vent metagenome TaxID=652676 RepID=A0A1W1CAJ2_9ZZZZ